MRAVVNCLLKVALASCYDSEGDACFSKSHGCAFDAVEVGAGLDDLASEEAWTVDDARWFLESAWHAGEALYAAFVLILVLGLRKGEVLGLTWELVDLDAAELYIGEQLQRVGGQLLCREVKTATSEAPLPLPGLCVTALKIRRRQQDADRARAGAAWIETGLVFTTRHGTPIEPRNFNRSFNPVHRRRQGAHDHRARHPQDMWLTTGCARRAPTLRDADPAAQQDRRHHGDLHQGTFSGHPGRAQ